MAGGGVFASPDVLPLAAGPLPGVIIIFNLSDIMGVAVTAGADSVAEDDFSSLVGIGSVSSSMGGGGVGVGRG